MSENITKTGTIYDKINKIKPLFKNNEISISSANLKLHRAENQRIVLSAASSLSNEFTEKEVKEAVSRIIDPQGDLTLNNLQPGNSVDHKLLERVTKLEIFSLNHDIKETAETGQVVSEFYNEFVNSFRFG
ncbi:MAG: hypothetical protein KGH61_01620 [Candidatus Micrarchaeota archaeon]|nr:hypothetical protein [Candidatus Micrarchaeota archaeon]MDE1847629.1 hypothetical protein [Candidatus Micrarchaeota archaeon]MDE1864450.1 hypothetical protein [Candidatus Micrarchaeota archaeon]